MPALLVGRGALAPVPRGAESGAPRSGQGADALAEPPDASVRAVGAPGSKRTITTSSEKVIGADLIALEYVPGLHVAPNPDRRVLSPVSCHASALWSRARSLLGLWRHSGRRGGWRPNASLTGAAMPPARGAKPCDARRAAKQRRSARWRATRVLDLLVHSPAPRAPRRAAPRRRATRGSRAPAAVAPLGHHSHAAPLRADDAGAADGGADDGAAGAAGAAGGRRRRRRRAAGDNLCGLCERGARAAARRWRCGWRRRRGEAAASHVDARVARGRPRAQAPVES